jgi:putative glycosyltransferase (TIGR04348 family)
MVEILIASPALQSANNGNWQTADRWSRFLSSAYRVSLDTGWDPTDHPDHAPIAVVLTGTDLYRDIHSDDSARRSLELATRLVVLQKEGLAELSDQHRAKCRVIYQSAPRYEPHISATRECSTAFDVVLVGHMRAEKDPLTAMRALDYLPDDSRVRLTHIGSALDDEYRLAAKALQARTWPAVQRYVWHDGLPHDDTIRRIATAQAMVVSSVMEGGANVIIEAVNAGVPVLASYVSGNVGMLGHDYGGYFPPGDYRELARLLDRVSRDEFFLRGLRQQCAQRAPLFAPEREQKEVIELVRDMLSFAARGRE